MIFKKNRLDGVCLIQPELKDDKRGFFTRIFCKDELKKNGLRFNIVQANRSLTKNKGTIRGLHFQREPHGEDKIVTCTGGSVYDVVVDVRPHSKTYGQWVAEELSSDNKHMLFIPKGFAHGFQTLSSDCAMLYFMSEYYAPDYATGIRWDDPVFNIRWPIKNPSLSEKDKNWPFVKA